MNTDKTKIPLSTAFFPGLLPIIGQEQYDQVLSRYYNLFENHPQPENPILAGHLFQSILPGLATYQILRESGLPQESALQKMDQIFSVLYDEPRKQIQVPGQNPQFFTMFQPYIRKAMLGYPEEGWQIEWLQEDQNAIRFSMSSCFILKTLTDYGAKELTDCFCRVDDLIYSEMSPFIEWKRTQTLAKGSSSCDFCFYAVNQKTTEEVKSE